jgi:excisionase family DNA binding protein
LRIIWLLLLLRNRLRDVTPSWISYAANPRPRQDPGSHYKVEIDLERLAYSVAEACAVAGIRKTTLYKEIRSGDLRAVKIGGRTVILVDDLRHWLNGRPPIIPEQD